MPEEPGEPPPLAPALPSWERLEEEGFGRALLLTLKEVLFNPATTFERMPRTTALGRPLLFAVLVGTVSAIVSMVYNVLSQTLSPAIAQEAYARFFQQLGMEQRMPGPREMLFWTMCSTALAPFLIVIAAFVFSGIFHLLLMLFGGANHGYETTFRTYCYTHGAASVLMMIPFCGQLVMLVWSVVVLIIGLSRSQETSPGKAAAAVLTPFVLCCCCIGLALGSLLGVLLPQLAPQLR